MLANVSRISGSWLISLSLLGSMLTPVAIAQEKMLHTVTVTGEGTEMIPATVAQVQLGVEVQGSNATEVQQAVAQKSSAVVELLRSRQVQQLQTTGISLQPNYDYSNNQRRLIGYIGANTVSFRLNTEKVGSLLDDTVQAGATRIDSISFTASDSEIAVAQKKALAEATLDAQHQANAVLKALNLNAKEVVSIQINGANAPTPILFQSEKAMNLAAPVSTPVVGGEQTIRASVTLQISY